ncbi:hypothetical protein MG293_007095 [Ovis ammon polii]|uniref:Transmembrane protein 33 n=2 Tax=Ovis TaxID=9935 RepID=A0AAD4UE07_OVIAM|nr:hypothetical protein MG293_007095 [Ovis ammon polii]KAI4572428.1 hypothetical protein MJT46_005496 [Ovis ammon polii x Ovis aries]
MRQKLLRLPGFLAYRTMGVHETGSQSKKNDSSRHASGRRSTVPSASPPLPHGSKASTSGFGNNLEPVALGRSCWALFRSSAFVSVFLETQFCSWRCQAGIFRPLRVPLGQSAALKGRDLCSVKVRKLRQRTGKPVPGVAAPALTFLFSLPDCSVSDASVSAPMADTAPNGPQGAGAVQFMMANKLDTAMWLSRLFTVYCSALFVLPVLGLHEAASFYQRALLANALTSALRLHQRLPHFQLSRAFLAQALLEDSCHYLLYSLIFVNSYPVTMSIFPVLLFSLLHAATYTKKILDAKGSNSLPLLRSLLDKLSTNQQNILKFIACNEIFLMPATVFMLFSGQGSLFQPFIYYRFLTLRYSSRRNPYCRTLFNELRIVVEHLIMKPACPLFVRRLCLQSIAFISRLAPTVA